MEAGENQQEQAQTENKPTCVRDECKCAHEQGIVISQNADGSFSQYKFEDAQKEMIKLDNLKKQLGDQI